MKLAQSDFDIIKLEQEVSQNVFVGGSIGDIVSAFLPYIYSIAGIALLLMLLAGGFQLMTSGGDPKGVEAGKQKITNALIGIIIVFASFWIVQVVGRILGIEIFKGIFE